MRATAPLRHPLRPDEILEAACRAIVARGFAETRVSDIAQLARTSTGTIHYYFDSKEEVLEAALRWAVERLVDLLEPAGEATATARLARLLELSIPHRNRVEYVLWMEMWTRALRSTERLEVLEPLSLRWRSLFFGVVRDGVVSGEFVPMASRAAVAERLIALVDGLGFETVVGYSWSTPDRMRTLLTEFAAEQLGLDSHRLATEMARVRT